MKYIPNCNAELEDTFELCWNCNYSLTENKVIELPPADPRMRDVSCLRCNVPLVFSGNYDFHEGEKMGVWGNLLEAFVNTESFDIYLCPRCGHVDFFTPRE